MTPAPVAGVLGWPVAHSRSPALHGYWLRRYGLQGAYLPFAVPPDCFDSALRGLQALGFAGANVTLPHKERALTLADEATARARRIGAANTLTVDEGGIRADNTDAFGFLESMRASAPGWRAGAGPALLLGAGGAARATAAALLDAGSPQVRVANRSYGRAEALADALGGPIEIVAWRDAAAAADGALTIVNATSLGMVGQPPLDVSLAAAPREAVVTDLIYTPLRTPLLERAAARGLRVVDGLGMLLHQARPGFEVWFGVAPEVDESLRAAVLA